MRSSNVIGASVAVCTKVKLTVKVTANTTSTRETNVRISLELFLKTFEMRERTWAVELVEVGGTLVRNSVAALCCFYTLTAGATRHKTALAR